MTNFKPQNSNKMAKTYKLPPIEDFFKNKGHGLPETGIKVKCTFHSACTHEKNGECNNFDTCSYQEKL
jgi:hypothetical protein